MSGTLAREDAAGWSRIEPGGGSAAVAAVPLAEDTERVEGLSAVSDDGRTVFLHVLPTVDGRTAELVEACNLADGELLAARDLFADVRGLAAPFTVPDPAFLVPCPTPVPLLAVPGFGSTGHLALDPNGTTALLDGPTGARLVDLAAGRTTTGDVGCPTVTTVTALAMSGRRALVLGSCPAPGPARPTLWMTG